MTLPEDTGMQNFSNKGLLLAARLLAALAFTAGQAAAAELAPPPLAQPASYAEIPRNKDTDLKLYLADGTLIKGADALGRMHKEAAVILWLAGNQFFAMDEVIHAFQKHSPGTAVGLITLPPGLLLKAIQTGGWTYGGNGYPGLPDIYASVNLGHLQTLKKSGLMEQYAVYMHNELQIMVAKGNPKRVQGIAELVRPGMRTSLPNPVDEGIMQFYARKVLERHGMWMQISGGKECVSCQTTPSNWFTAVHHRETPDRIKAGTADAGIVWKTEVLAAVRDGAPVEGVELPAADSLRDEVAYAIGSLTKSPHREAAGKYLQFLSTPEGQEAYAKYGFVKATAQELAQKLIP